MDPLPDVVRYSVGAGGGGAGGPGESGSHFFLANRKVVGVGREIDVCAGRGWGGREEVIKEGCVDTFRSVFVREGREAGLLTTGSEPFGLPYRGGVREERYSDQYENLAFFMALK